MKPIQLTIAGLQSYREKQEIDFTRLCDAGVFGIFGPTGSGKSTILDAMTLALYGEVERASGGTQGILNHAESTLAVSFTFELSSPAGWERYRVDRQYKRSGDASLLQTVSRLVRLATAADNDPVVLADKSKEVTKSVQDTLGLSMHDFTRAVVLPQGKFAEFLSLTNKDRRQMLQRLFSLEAYGDQLNARLSSRLKATDVRLKQVAAEQQGLGDASAEALRAATARLSGANRSAAEIRARLLASEARRDALRQRWTWQLEREQLHGQLQELASREETVALWERSLGLAAAADRLLPFLREREETARRQAVAAHEQAAAAESLAGASRGHQAAAEAHAAAQQALLAGEAGLSVRLERLRQALALQLELQRLAAEAAQLAASREQAAAALADGAARLRQQRELRERAQLKQQELQRQLLALEVPAERRHRLQAAALDKQQLAAAARHAAELAAEAAGAAQALERLGEQRRALTAREAAHGAALAADAAAAAGEREALRRLAGEASRLQAAAAAAQARLQAEARERETARLAAHLAAALADGEPCPVCGAIEHPRLVHGAPTPVPADADAAPSDEPAAGLEALRDALQPLQFRLQQQAAKLEELTEAWSRRQPASVETLAEAAASLAPLQSVTSDVDLVELPVPSLLKAADTLTAQAAAAGERVARLEEAFRNTQQQERQLELQQQELTARLEAAQATHETARAKQRQAETQLQQLSTAWTERYADWTVERIDEERERLAEQDKQAEELRERLAKSGPFLESTDRQIEELQAAQVQLDRELAHLDAQSAARRQAAEEKAVQLRERAEGDDVAGLMRETEAELQRIRRDELSARERLAAQLAELQRSQERHSAAEEAKRSTAEAAVRAEEQWQSALQATSFTSQEEVERARLPEAEIESRTSSIRAHREQETKLKLKLQSLDDQLQGEQITEAQWNACVAEWNEAREQDEAALQEAARAARDLEETEAKHVKWSELERARVELESLAARLGKLQSVLRGNAFVEYVAEEQLTVVSRAASQRLGELTGQRYAIEVDSTGGFLIRDDANGGVRRPVSTLSGGETFLASLALALALSAQIQLRGRYPLQFFFLDEGFGTLDQELLESVIGALEKLHLERLTVGVISHVPELRARLPRRLIVQPAAAAGEGSRVSLESG